MSKGLEQEKDKEDSHDTYRELQEELDFPGGVCRHGVPLEQECSKCYIQRPRDEDLKIP